MQQQSATVTNDSGRSVEAPHKRPCALASTALDDSAVAHALHYGNDNCNKSNNSNGNALPAAH